MRFMHVLTPLLALAISSTVFAADHPEMNELTPLLSQAIDSDTVQSFVEKYQLQKGYKADSGSFSSKDQAYSLMFDENRISSIHLQVSPSRVDPGNANWTVYSRPLLHDLKASDHRPDVIKKLGKPTKPGGDRWVDQGLELWVLFRDKGGFIGEIFVSAVQAKS